MKPSSIANIYLNIKEKTKILDFQKILDLRTVERVVDLEKPHAHDRQLTY